MLVLIQPYVVLEVHLAIVDPFVVILFAPPLEPPHGPPSKHENHTNHPLCHSASICVTFTMLLSLEVICSYFLI
jgi:hypothetical protein